MSRLVLLVALLIAATPSLGFPCGNEVERTKNEEVRLVIKAERYLEKGMYKRARAVVRSAHRNHSLQVGLRDPRLNRRLDDVRALVALRLELDRDTLAGVVEYLEGRSEAARGTNPRFRAWLAEAYAVTGKLDEARAIFAELQELDLMPDAFAYLALARISSGSVRQEALTLCTRRAKAKAICRLPADAAKPRSLNAARD